MRFVLLAVAGLAVVPVGAAVAALIGLGLVRSLPPLEVAMVAILLPALPVAGIWALGGRTLGAGALGAWAWPLALLWAIPGYFPGELSAAVGTGVAVLTSVAGVDASRRAADLVAARAPTGEPPPPLAEAPAETCPPCSVAAPGDSVALPYEGTGHSLAIPVLFGDVELQMLFDTGATVTTLDRASLRTLGISVPADAPEVTLRTANGERTTQLVLVPRVWVGGLPVDGVTVGVCEECADGRTAGLLGLNVSSQFLVTVDTQRREVVFAARDGEPERLIDVQPWLAVSSTATRFGDGRVEVTVDAQNRSSRRVVSAHVGIACGARDFVVTLEGVAPGDRASETVSLPRGTECASYAVSLQRARW